MASDRTAVLVTGAANVVGEALAERFAGDDQYDLVVCLDDGDGAHDVADAVPGGVGHVADFTDPEAVEAVVADVESEATIEAAVSTVILAEHARIGDLDEEMWDRGIDRNLKSQYAVARAVGPRMFERERGYIVNDSSISGTHGSTSSGVQYSAAKAGTFGLTRGLAKQLSPHVRVNCVVHGFIEKPTEVWNEAAIQRYNEMLPLGRRGDPDEIARVMQFLCGEGAGYMTGSVVPVDGGLSLVPSREFLRGESG